jgi:hypothetical protein
MRVLKMLRYGPIDPVTKPKPSVTKPRNETPDVAKPDDRSSVAHVADFVERRLSRCGRGGRPPAGAVAMSDAERMRKYRERRRGAVAAS